MRKMTGLMCVLGLGLALIHGVAAAPPAAISWLTDAQSGTAKSAETGLPALVYFTADYCGYCKKLDRDVWSQTAVAGQVSTKFVPVKINASQDPRTPRTHKITGYPTIVVFSPDGKELSRIVGYSNATSIQSKLNAALNKLPKQPADPVAMQ